MQCNIEYGRAEGVAAAGQTQGARGVGTRATLETARIVVERCRQRLAAPRSARNKVEIYYQNLDK